MTPITITIFLKTALLIYFELNFLFLQLITRPIMWVTVNDRSKEKANARVATIFPPGFFLTKQSAKRIYVTSPVGTVVRKTYRRNFGQKLFRTAVHKTRGWRNPSGRRAQGSRTNASAANNKDVHTPSFEFSLLRFIGYSRWDSVPDSQRSGAPLNHQRIANELERYWTETMGELMLGKRTFIASFRAGSTVARSARAISSSFLHSFCSSAIRCDRAATVLCVSSASRLWFTARKFDSFLIYRVKIGVENNFTDIYL